MRAPQARRKRAPALLGACWAWARGGEAELSRRGVHRVASRAGKSPLGSGLAGEANGRWLGKEAAWRAPGNGGGRNGGGWVLETGGGGVRGGALLVWWGDLEDIYPRLAKDDSAALGASAEPRTE